MTDSRPPWPGTKPGQLEFPFARAQAAIEAIRDLVADLRDLRSAIEGGVGDLHGGAFHGEFAELDVLAGDQVWEDVRSSDDATRNAAIATITEITQSNPLFGDAVTDLTGELRWSNEGQ